MSKTLTTKQQLRTGLIMTGVGAVILLPTYYNVRRAKSTPDWPKTDGVVASSQMKETFWGKSTSPKRYRHYHKFKIEYRYSVDGTEYNSKRFSFTTKYLRDREKIDYYKDNYQQAQTIEVYYNPARPSESVLIRGLPKFNRPSGRLLFGWLLFGFGAFGTFVYGSKFLRERKAAGRIDEDQ